MRWQDYDYDCEQNSRREESASKTSKTKIVSYLKKAIITKTKNYQKISTTEKVYIYIYMYVKYCLKALQHTKY